jgi:hypothetical protein
VRPPPPAPAPREEAADADGEAIALFSHLLVVRLVQSDNSAPPIPVIKCVRYRGRSFVRVSAHDASALSAQVPLQVLHRRGAEALRYQLVHQRHS